MQSWIPDWVRILNFISTLCSSSRTHSCQATLHRIPRFLEETAGAASSRSPPSHRCNTTAATTGQVMATMAVGVAKIAAMVETAATQQAEAEHPPTAAVAVVRPHTEPAASARQPTAMALAPTVADTASAPHHTSSSINTIRRRSSSSSLGTHMACKPHRMRYRE